MSSIARAITPPTGRAITRATAGATAQAMAQATAQAMARATGQAMRRTGPGAVLVWSQTRETGDPAGLVVLPDLRPAPLVLLGGPGWWPVEPPRGQRVGDLSEAITMLSRAAGA